MSLPPLLARMLSALLLPFASLWIARQERCILVGGMPLNDDQLLDAHTAGVKNPKRIRLLHVGAIPFAHRPFLRRLAIKLRLVSPHISGLTARYGIFVRAERWDDRSLVAHELAHVAQYERLGGIRPFLQQYLSEWLVDGYPLGQLEIEAAEIARKISAAL